MAPAFTVLIPVFNGENFLAEAVTSALAQSYPATEVLVVDDGSTDSSADIARSFGSRVRLLQQPRGGIAAARNAGIAAAATPWVALLDHDDLWEPNHLLEMAAAIERCPTADVVYSPFRRLIWDHGGNGYRAVEPDPAPSEADVVAVLMERCAILVSTIAIRASAVIAIGGFDSYYINAQDWDLWVRLALHGSRFALAPQPTTLYRIHKASQSHQPLRALRFYRDVVERDILPSLPAWRRTLHRLRVISRLEAEASVVLRELGAPGAVAAMSRSIARWPFADSRRYKVLLHLVLRGYQKRRSPPSIGRAHTT
jgi:glycosyltransferase involved in cell wall biosynthesis